jgi:hypothetical protein
MRLDTQQELKALGVTVVCHEKSVLSWAISLFHRIFSGIPHWHEQVCMTIDPKIYVPSLVLDYADQKISADFYDAVLRHEMVHIKQQRSKGKYIWLLMYLALPSFRLHAEIEAYRVQFDAGMMDIGMIVDSIDGMYKVGVSRDKLRSMLAEAYGKTGGVA